MNPWTAKTLTVSEPLKVKDFIGLTYEGHDPYGDDESVSDTERRSFYNENAGDYGGLVGYFNDSDLVGDLVARLNYFTPGFAEGWRWQTYDTDTRDNQGDFVKSLSEGITGIYNPEGELVGYMVPPPISPAVYIVLAVLNAGPVPIRKQ